MLGFVAQASAYALRRPGLTPPRRLWRLLDTGLSDAARNMALEQVLLDNRVNDNAPDTLHFLEFKPCVLLGYHQSADEEIHLDYCRRQGIEINRRISGGGCIYMDGGTLGWEIVAKKGADGIPGSLDAMYDRLCGGLIQALAAFGITAAYRPLNDVEVAGRKVCGTGGADMEDSLIFHGSVLVAVKPEVMDEALKNPDKRYPSGQRAQTARTAQIRQASQTGQTGQSGQMGASVGAGQAAQGGGAGPTAPAGLARSRVVGMDELLGYTPDMSEVKKHICGAFADLLGVDFLAGGLTGEEEENLRRERPRFASEEWIYRR